MSNTRPRERGSTPSADAVQRVIARDHWSSRVGLSVPILLASASAYTLFAQEQTPEQGPPPAQVSESPDVKDTTEDEIEDDSLDAIDLFDMEIPVVVTASRREQKITGVPYAISVITAEDIRQSGVRSVPDALRLAPGVDVAELSYGQAAVSPRGMHGFLASQTLVLVDGRQIYDPGSAGTFWGSWPFQMEDIARIEVIRGPGGVTWGANAVNGVINIITKDPADQLGFRLTTTGASRGSFKQHGAYGFQEGSLSMRLSAEYEGSDGFKDGGSFLVPLREKPQFTRLGIHAVHAMSPDDTLTFSVGHQSQRTTLAPAIASGFNPPHPTQFATFLLTKWDHKIAEDNRMNVTGYVNSHYVHAIVRPIEYHYLQFALQFSHAFNRSEAHTTTWGVDTRLDLMDATNADPYFMRTGRITSGAVALYAQDEWRFTPNWTLNLGGRIDYDSYGGFEPAARAALSYAPDDRSLFYGAVSRAFRMPPGAQRATQFPIADGLAQISSDPGRDAAQLLAYELGYRGRLFDRLDCSVNLFWHEYNGVATFTPGLGPTGVVLNWDNNAPATIYGVEMDAKYALSKKLTLLGNYTFQRTDWRYPLGFAVATNLIESPEHKFMVGARYDATDDLHLSSHLYYVGAVRAPNPLIPLIHKSIDSYFRLDVKAEYKFQEDQASIAVGVRNLLDSGHFEGSTMFLNDAEVPRMFFVELRMGFD